MHIKDGVFEMVYATAGKTGVGQHVEEQCHQCEDTMMVSIPAQVARRGSCTCTFPARPSPTAQKV